MARRPPRRKHPLLRARAARGRHSGRPGRVLDALEAVQVAQRRRPRGFLLDAARGVREAARAHDSVRPGVPHFLPQARLYRKADRLDAAGDAAAASRRRRRRARSASRRRCSAGSTSATTRLRSRDRRAADRVRPRGAAEEGLRADDGGRDRRRPRRRSRGWRCRSIMVRTRRLAASRRGQLIDIRRTLRASMKAGGAVIDLKYLGPREKGAADRGAARYFRLDEPVHAAVPAFPACAHRCAEARDDLPVRHAADQRHPRHPRSAIRTRRSPPARRNVADWSGGTRIASSLRDFNKQWARRVLGQGAVVLLITDGLERDADDTLAFEMDRLHRSCRRLVWLNPLLRFEGFEAARQGRANHAAAC